MGLTNLTSCVIWFICVSMSWMLPASRPVIHGLVQSPQYPQPYHPNLLKQWELVVPDGYQIQMSLIYLDLKDSASCNQDSLTVLYGVNVLGKFCGQENSTNHPGKATILPPGNRLTLIFQTSDSASELQQHTGFSATYEANDIDECSEGGFRSEPLCSQICINTPGSYRCSCYNGYKLHLDQRTCIDIDECSEGGFRSEPLCSQICINTPGFYRCSCYNGYKLHLDLRTCIVSCSGCMFDKQGYLSSPEYPRPSPPFLSCKYIISVEHKFVVTLNFTEHFHIQSTDTEQGPSCPHHWLQVTIPGKKPMKLCGRKSPGLIATNSSIVRLDYHTDGEHLSNGWSLHYSTHEIKCTHPGKIAKGMVTPAQPEYFLGDYISVTCEEGYKLMNGHQEIKEFSAMCQRGGWHLPPLVCQVIDCGEPEPLLNGGRMFLSGFKNQYLSVVQYYCNEPFYSPLGGINVTFTCMADGKWKSKHADIEIPVCIPVCGQPTEHISVIQRIVGGSDAPEHTIPWQVLLNANGERGGGMVIADRWIMTAATVVDHRGIKILNESLKIYMGHTDARKIKDSPVYAASIHVHPEYNNHDGSNFNNDIALIKLLDPITFNASVMPVCLPTKNATYDTGMMGQVSGFGVTDDRSLRFLSNKLKYVQIPVVDQEICNNSFALLKKKRKNVPNLTNNMFCAGLPEGGRDSCQGDSGSTFTLTENERFWAAGIVSWGDKCGAAGSYGVYTRVVNYLDWINKIMQEN